MEFIKESPPDSRSRWDELMDLALKEAEKAAQKGEIPVGAILVDESGQIIGRGYNQSITRNDPTAHAEIQAIRQGCLYRKNYRIPGTTLVVTLEPCLMCLGAIIHARIQRVVYGASDPKTGAVTSRMQGADLSFSNHHFEVVPGIREHECSRMLTEFFKQRRTQIKAAATASEASCDLSHQSDFLSIKT
jgi:tRNA(adenine34) deaminase